MWNLNTVFESLEYLRERAKSNTRVFHPLATEAEIEKDKSLEDRVIFHFPAKSRSRFAVVVPGGAYTGVASIQEGFPIAQNLNALGYHAFVLHYRTGKNALAPNPQDDLAAAVRFILDNAEQLNVDTKDYAVFGFSAGGHLAASYGTSTLGYGKYGLPKPGCLVLGYPVITMEEHTHQDSRKNLLGKGGTKVDEERAKYSIEKQVDSAYPPSFIWNCAKDDTVP
ncbi:alpha/beta hydrolase, partial [Ruminococcaceae bacterium OttesenSCG-928-A11]|nr:alpha/beta hydrolase [Ruminococcaceae bacterium OttesenSCG-928-A11]